MTTGGETVRTTVVDGVATVEDAAGSRAVPLADAAAPPSLKTLRALSPSEATGGARTGDDRRRRRRGGPGRRSGRRRRRHYTDVITGYAMTDPAGRWDLAVTFRGVDEDPTP